MDNNKHFTEKKYVVYKRRVAWHQYYTDRVEEETLVIQRH